MNSMTGFSENSLHENGIEFKCIAKSLNSRFLEILIKLPNNLKSNEGWIRDLLQKNFSRGKVELEIFYSRAYGVGFHRHNSEIDQELKNNSSSRINFTFTPHIIPMFRGILSTIYLDLKPGTTLNKVQNILKIFHKKNKFVKIKNINSFLSTNDVMNTNYCFISVCKTKFKDKIIILSVIDNLIKGGAGQQSKI